MPCLMFVRPHLDLLLLHARALPLARPLCASTATAYHHHTPLVLVVGCARASRPSARPRLPSHASYLDAPLSPLLCAASRHRLSKMPALALAPPTPCCVLLAIATTSPPPLLLPAARPSLPRLHPRLPRHASPRRRPATRAPPPACRAGYVCHCLSLPSVAIGASY